MDGPVVLQVLPPDKGELHKVALTQPRRRRSQATVPRRRVASLNVSQSSSASKLPFPS